MADVLDIAEVARRTGVTSRALRFYEARGILKPLRTASGRRVYGAGELQRIQQVLALKKAGLAIAQIQQLMASKPLDLAGLVDAQLDAIEAQTRSLAEAKALLLSIRSRIEAGAEIDLSTFCLLIRQGDRIMEHEGWDQIAARYISPEERREWNERMAALPKDFNRETYARQWKELGDRITAAMPLEPASPEAQAFVDEWFALLKPFTDVATPAMMMGANRMYDDMGSWEGRADPGFSKAVWDLMKAATAARLAQGGSVGGVQ